MKKNGAQLATDPARRALMQRVKQRGTPPERTIARICRELGLSYRLNVKALPGTPDLANKSRKWAIFANGCFWHGHTNCDLATRPKRNERFWHDKFVANRRRDARKIRELRRMGYRVVVVWQCQTDDVAGLRKRLSKLSEPGLVNPA